MMSSTRIQMPAILKKAEAAMKAAVRQVMIDHKHKKLPIYVLRNNKVTRIPPHRIKVR